MKQFKELRNKIKEDYAQDLDLAQKNMARLAKQEKGQEKKDYMAVARALNQGNLGAVKKVIKGISTDEIKADILNVLVGYNYLIAKMYPKAVDAKGRLKTPMSVSKLIKDDVNEGTYMITVRKGGPGGKDLNVKVKGRDKNDAVKQWRMKNKKYKNDEVEVSESDANWAKSLEKINKKRQLDKISDKDKETLMKIAALLGKERKKKMKQFKELRKEGRLTYDDGGAFDGLRIAQYLSDKDGNKRWSRVSYGDSEDYLDQAMTMLKKDPKRAREILSKPTPRSGSL